MKNAPLITCLAGFLLLAACATPEQRAAQISAQRTIDEAECSTLGFTAGTESFADCLLRLKEIRTQEARTRALNNSRRYPFWPGYGLHHPYRYPYRY